MKRIAFTALCVAAALVLAAGTAAAQCLTLKVSPEVSLKMAVLDGLCALDANGKSFDRAVLERTETIHRGVNAVLAFLADCPSIEANRQGKPTDMKRWVIVLAQLHDGQAIRLPGMSRAEYLNEMAKLMPGADKIAEEAARETSARIAAILKDQSASVDLQRMLGPLARDSNGLYVGTISVNRLAGREVQVAGLGAFTFLRGHALTVNFFTPYAGPKDFERLIAEAKAMAADLAKRND
jgi:hypothetical protein